MKEHSAFNALGSYAPPPNIVPPPPPVRCNALLGDPIAYLDENGAIVIVGPRRFAKASFVDENRAIPDSWTRLVPYPPNPTGQGMTHETGKKV